MRALLLIALVGCNLDTQRMLEQPRDQPFRDEMRTPPEGTVPYHAQPEPDPPTALPALGRAALEQGRRDFEAFCAACHGVRGDGISPVAAQMVLRRPPSLLDPSLDVTRVWRAISLGYGLMRPYRNELSPDARLGVIGYLEALRLSQSVRLEELPPDLQRQFP